MTADLERWVVAERRHLERELRWRETGGKVLLVDADRLHQLEQLKVRLARVDDVLREYELAPTESG